MTDQFHNTMRHAQTWLGMPALGLLLLVATGCSNMANYNKQASGFYSAYREGRLVDASNQVTAAAASNSGSNSGVLYHLERGSVLRTAGHQADSTSALTRAEVMVQDFEARAKVSARDVGNEVNATVTNDRVLSYEGYAYDRIMLNTYKALNFLHFGNMEAARVELRRAYGRQQDAVRQHQAEIEATAGAARKQGLDYGSIANDPQYALKWPPGAPSVAEYAAYADFVNPFTTWLDGVVFMHTSNDPSDWERARRSLERVTGMIGRHPALMADLRALEQGLDGPIVYVVVENGVAPTRREQRFDLPLPVNNQIYYAGVALPQLVFHRLDVQTLQISADGRSLGQTDRLCSMDAIVAAEFDARYSQVVTRALMGAAIRLASQIAVGEVVRREKGDDAALLASAAMSLISFAVTRADLRTWQTLPKEWQFARIQRPRGGALQLTGGPLNLNVTLPDAEVCMVYVRTAPPGLLKVETLKLR